MIDIQTKWVSVLVFDVDRHDMQGFARQAELVMRRRIPLMRGFVEGIVMADEDKTRMLIVSQWDSKDAWAASQWDEGIARALGDLVENANSFEFQGYEPITIIRSA